MAISYFFRYMNEDGVPDGTIGLATASSLVELFWEIDQYFDPCGVQIHPVRKGSFCIDQSIVGRCVDDDEWDYEYEGFKLTDYFPYSDSPKWKTPPWATREGYRKMFSDDAAILENNDTKLAETVFGHTPVDKCSHEPIIDTRPFYEAYWKRLGLA